jgi:hypothetical protein
VTNTGPDLRPRIGKPLGLDQLDEDDNFVATTLMDQYCATFAETWFGVPAGDLLPGSPHALQ